MTKVRFSLLSLFVLTTICAAVAMLVIPKSGTLDFITLFLTTSISPLLVLMVAKWLSKSL